MDAKVIATIPYNDGPYDTTTAAPAGIEREVWYKWVADQTAVMYFTTFGSNYNAHITVFSGACGSLTKTRSA